MGSVVQMPARKRMRGGIIGIVVVSVVALMVATPARAVTTATPTLAPIGSGSYLLTLTNSGSETITNFDVPAGQNLTNAVPSPACNTSALSGAIFCEITLVPGASTQVCYTGPAATQVVLNGYYPVNIPGLSAAVASCPLPDFTTGSSSGSGSGGKGAHAWTSTQCRTAYKAWTKGHHHATRSRQKAEANKLHKQHGCPPSTLK
jgi:hypothetical protein